MTKKEPSENSKWFVNLMRKWQDLEDTAIASAEELIRGTDNPLVKMTMELIKHDSEKHKLVQQMIIDNLTKEAVHVSPDELVALSDMLNKHMEAEEEALYIAGAALEKSELFITRFLLSYLIADEKKHHGLIEQLNDLKRAAISTSTGARSHGYIERPPSDIERTHPRKK